VLDYRGKLDLRHTCNRGGSGNRSCRRGLTARSRCCEVACYDFISFLLISEQSSTYSSHGGLCPKLYNCFDVCGPRAWQQRMSPADKVLR
jgi:hypothetical protein